MVKGLDFSLNCSRKITDVYQIGYDIADFVVWRIAWKKATVEMRN